MEICELQAFMTPDKHGHLVGIGGVSMSPLAEVLQGAGMNITGSDMQESPAVQHLRSIGIPVVVGQRAENLDGVDYIIRTAAAREDNPEIAEARRLGIPVFERAQAWGYIMRTYENAVCISGTHGKTTATSMCTHILMEAQKDPTVMIGGTLPLLQAGHRVGGGDTIVLESCEYYNSFHSFFPTVAVILDIEADHLDFFKDLEDVKASFRKFAELVPERGTVVANGDDENTVDTLKGIDKKVVTFGLSEDADIRAAELTRDGVTQGFDILRNGEFFTHVGLNVPGQHNVLNALAAAAACMVLGVGPEAVSAGLFGFCGAGRRFEYKGNVNGARVYDDYAHHPGELKALLDTVLDLDYERVLVAFQPHTYTRTKALFHDFAAQLRRPHKVYLAEIFAAREQNTIGISSADLAAEIDGAVYCPDFATLEKELLREAKPGDLVLTVGAGDIFKVGEAITRE